MSEVRADLKPGRPNLARMIRSPYMKSVSDERLIEILADDLLVKIQETIEARCRTHMWDEAQADAVVDQLEDVRAVLELTLPKLVVPEEPETV